MRSGPSARPRRCAPVPLGPEPCHGPRRRPRPHRRSPLPVLQPWTPPLPAVSGDLPVLDPHVNGTVCIRAAACLGVSGGRGQGGPRSARRWLGTSGCGHLRPGSSSSGCPSGWGRGVTGLSAGVAVTGAATSVADEVGRRATASWGSGCSSVRGHGEPLGVVGAGGNEQEHQGPRGKAGVWLGKAGAPRARRCGGGGGSREWRALGPKQQPGRERTWRPEPAAPEP